MEHCIFNLMVNPFLRQDYRFCSTNHSFQLKHLILNMHRKKWTANTEVTEELLKFREKRKWQLALRRYILEKKASSAYAPYFGLDVERFRKWIEIQFEPELNWENFGTAWQLDHILPVTCFDFSNKEDMHLCWNFINIRVENLEHNKNSGNRIDALTVKPYFRQLYSRTNYHLCLKMLEKIEQIEVSGILSTEAMEKFISENLEQIETLASLTEEEYTRLNTGTALKDIILERQILKKFGN